MLTFVYEFNPLDWRIFIEIFLKYFSKILFERGCGFKIVNITVYESLAIVMISLLISNTNLFQIGQRLLLYFKMKRNSTI